MGIGLPLHAKHRNAWAGMPTKEYPCTPAMPLLYSVRGSLKNWGQDGICKTGQGTYA